MLVLKEEVLHLWWKTHFWKHRCSRWHHIIRSTKWTETLGISYDGVYHVVHVDLVMVKIARKYFGKLLGMVTKGTQMHIAVNKICDLWFDLVYRPDLAPSISETKKVFERAQASSNREVVEAVERWIEDQKKEVWVRVWSGRFNNTEFRCKHKNFIPQWQYIGMHKTKYWLDIYYL